MAQTVNPELPEEYQTNADKLSEQEMIKRLFLYGHAFNPDYPGAEDLTEGTLPSKLSEPKAKIMVASYQDFLLPEMDNMAMLHHGRPTRRLGIAGSATHDLLRLKRCGKSDFTPESALGVEALSGTWGMPCLNKGIGVSFEYRTLPSSMPISRWERIVHKVMGYYHQIGSPLYEVPFDHPTLHEHIRFKWRNRAGWIGLAQFNNQTCTDSVFCYCDPGYMSQNDDQVGRLLKHEWGHNHNFQHVRQGTGDMSPVITRGVLKPWGPDDASWRFIVRSLGGEPKFPENGDGEGPTPPPPTDDGIFRFMAEGSLMEGNRDRGTYILTLRKKPEA